MSTKRKTTIKAYNYVYKIIQLSTGREYIGKHKTDNLNDGYMGSGTLITPAVLENPSDFVKTIIWYCDSESKMNELEAALVTEEYLLKNFPEKTFNQVPGGDVPLNVVLKWQKKLYPEKRVYTVNTKKSSIEIDGKVYEFPDSWRENQRATKNRERYHESYHAVINAAQEIIKHLGYKNELMFSTAIKILETPDFCESMKGDIPKGSSQLENIIKLINGMEFNSHGLYAFPVVKEWWEVVIPKEHKSRISKVHTAVKQVMPVGDFCNHEQLNQVEIGLKYSPVKAKKKALTYINVLYCTGESITDTESYAPNGASGRVKPIS